jgi:hypothetical protein
MYIYIYIYICARPTQDSMMMHMEIIYSMMWLIKPKTYKNNQYYADNHLGNISKDSITGWEIKNNIYVHSPMATGSGLGCPQMATPLFRSILIEG